MLLYPIVPASLVLVARNGARRRRVRRAGRVPDVKKRLLRLVPKLCVHTTSSTVCLALASPWSWSWA